MESSRPTLPRNVKLLGWASCLNDVASEMIFPLLPTFIVSVLGGSRTSLGLIEGAADSLASLLKLAAGHWSDRSGQRRRFILIGYACTALLRPCLGTMTAAIGRPRIGNLIPGEKGFNFSMSTMKGILLKGMGAIGAVRWLAPGGYM